MQRTQTSKRADNQSLSTLQVAAEFILQMKKILSGWYFQDTQATANEHLLDVSVCNGWKLEDLTLSINSGSVHFADFYLSNELRLSWKDKQNIFIRMKLHVWVCHVPLQPQLYLMVIVCLPMEIVSFSCADNVQQLLFTSGQIKSIMFQTWLGSRILNH